MKRGGFSILHCSRQRWKLRLMAVSAAIGVILCVLAELLKAHMDNGAYVVLLAVSVVLGIVAILFPCLSIRCPVCGARWFWGAISRKHEVGPFDWLAAQAVCPSCGSSCTAFADRTARLRR